MKSSTSPYRKQISKGQKKGRNNFLQNKRLPIVMGNIFDDLLPSFATKKKEPEDVYGRKFSIAQKKGPR